MGPKRITHGRPGYMWEVAFDPDRGVFVERPLRGPSAVADPPAPPRAPQPDLIPDEAPAPGPAAAPASAPQDAVPG